MKKIESPDLRSPEAGISGDLWLAIPLDLLTYVRAVNVITNASRYSTINLNRQTFTVNSISNRTEFVYSLSN